MPRPKTHMKLITLYLPFAYLEQLNELVNEKKYPNRAEAIRLAIRDMLIEKHCGLNLRELRT